ncbi:PFA4 [Candida oxycetoniae]|uniref:PFA4 n=1 Tax=Candida oxycetoniae TaxID=497107 RepID=A0AAI9WZK7_9ASCO|nr:PFA4 [Candida oxycetoniae]KAI3406472.1 PFA4 [Candida oxycetoniae]
MPIYLIRRAELASVIVFTVLDVFVLLTISLLFIRCVLNLAKGMTQIEVWEWERLESQFHSRRLWMQIRSNYEKVFGKKLPKLSTWTNATLEEEDVDEEEVEVDEEDEVEEEKEKKEYPPEWSESELDAEAKDKRKEGKDSDIHLQESPKRSSSSENLNKETEPTVVPTNFTIDDIIFPYDYGVYGNLKAALGSPLFWLIPWKGSRRNGYDMELSKDYKEYDQLGLPWPPDGCYKELSVGDQFHIKRSQWQNDMGEGLNDFGVETDVEDDEEQ